MSDVQRQHTERTTGASERRYVQNGIRDEHNEQRQERPAKADQEVHCQVVQDIARLEVRVAGGFQLGRVERIRWIDDR